MAQIIIEINDNIIPRIKDAFKGVLIEGDAVDLQNPTNQEIILKVKSHLKNSLRGVVFSHEERKEIDSFIFVELE